MKKICSWCGKSLPLENTHDAHSCDIITHGICEECEQKMSRSPAMDLNVFIDRLPAPVVVIDAEGKVKTANRLACAVLHKDLVSMPGYRTGDVFECKNARLPEGCGRTSHCSGCTIRTTIMHTLLSGESHLNVPAYLCRGDAGESREVRVRISTEKSGEAVLLRIDETGENW